MSIKNKGNRFSIGDFVRQTSYRDPKKYSYYVILDIDPGGEYKIWSVSDGCILHSHYPLDNAVTYRFDKVRGEQDCL